MRHLLCAAMALALLTGLASCDGSGAVQSGAITLTVAGGSTVAENSVGALPIIVNDPAGKRLSFMVSGPDAALFNISPDPILSFKAPPDFEAPTDANRDNVYEVDVIASDGRRNATLQIAVVVTDVAELPEGIASFAITTNANSSQLFSVTLTDGQTYAFQGQRQESGAPASLESAFVSNIRSSQQEYNGSGAQVYTDPAGRFGEFYFDNGAYVSFAYDEDGRISAINAVSDDGEAQGIIDVDPPSAAGSVAAAAAGARPPNIRRGRRMRATSILRHDSGCGTNVVAGGSVRQQGGPGTTAAQVTVRECGQPLSGARVVVVRQTAGLAPTYPADDAGGGVYRAHVPVAVRPGPSLESQCNSLRTFVGDACSAFSDVGGSRPGSVERIARQCIRLINPKLIAACVVAVEIAGKYCEFGAPFVSGSPGGDAIGEAICNSASELLDDVADAQVSYYAIAYLPGGGQARSGAVTASKFGPIPGLNIDTADITAPAVTTFISPSDPAPTQGYRVLVSVSCRANADRVRVSVSGTDGYADSVTCPLANKQGDCQISVPGGAAGVVDTITIVAGNTTRTLQVIF